MPPSCVASIQDALASLLPPPSSVDVSIVTQSVTVQHPRALSVSAIKAAIGEAGYDILSTPTIQQVPQQPWSDSLARPSWVPASKQQRKKHLESCAQCRAEEEADMVRSTDEHTNEVSICCHHAYTIHRTHIFVAARWFLRRTQACGRELLLQSKPPNNQPL